MPDELEQLKGCKGKAVYFHHFHPKTGKFIKDAEDGLNLEVEGKPRRMLILGKCWWFDWSTFRKTGTAPKLGERGETTLYRLKGRPGFLVVPLVSACPRNLESIHSRPRMGLLDKGSPTVICYIPVVYPAECCCQGPAKSIPSDVVNEVVKELWLRGLGLQSLDPQLISGKW